MGPIPTPMEESSTYSSVYRRSRPGTLPLPATSSAPSKKLTLTSTLNTITTITIFLALLLIDELPRQAYLHLLLRIPSLYFSRVTRIFEEARLSLPDIKRMARSRVEEWDDKQNPNQMPSFLFGHPDRGPLPRSLLNFKTSWDSFIDSLMREWKTLNVISVLLMSAILTLLQIENASHPIIRTTALFSLICSLMSLLYGCIYIIRFGTMRKMHKASSFATDAQRNVGFWWNVWVMLAMPAIWLSWSIITFLASIMSFIWLSGTSADSADVVLSDGAALGVRIGLTFVLAVGLVYFVLIVREFHRYGDPLDQAWLRAVNQWAIEYPYPAPQPQPPTPPLGWTNPSNSYPYPHPNSRPAPSPRVPGSRNLADPFTHYTPARDLSSHSARPLRPRSWVSWQQPTHRPRSPSRQTDSSNRSRSPTYIVPPYTASHVDPDELYNELPADHRKTPSELPAGFSRTFIVPDNNTVPLTPVTVMRLGREENSSTFNSHALQRAHVPLSVVEAVPQEDWDRFLLDVSSAWRGDLALTQKAGGDVQSNDSPSYTVVQQQPPHLRPGAPSPPSLSPSPVVPSPSKVHTRTIADTANRVEGSDEENSPQRLSAVAEENGDDTVMPDHDRDVGETSSSRRTKSNAGTNTATKQSLSQSQSPTNVNFGEASIFSDTRSRTRTLSSERAQAQAVQDFINLWNERYFCARNLKARLVPTPALRLQDGLAPASDSDWRRRTEFVVVLSTPRQPAAAVGENSNQDARRMDNEQPLHTERTTSRSGSEAGGPSRSFTTADDNDNGDTIL
ncbi:hypothetical protein C8F01DRAFT_744447 [Mycena amicta]|nr:hypothetical protein C8F01DRAFT_744447 [Mycena amicta]